MKQTTQHDSIRFVSDQLDVDLDLKCNITKTIEQDPTKILKTPKVEPQLECTDSHITETIRQDLFSVPEKRETMNTGIQCNYI